MSRYFRQLAKRAMEEQQAAQDLAVTEEVIVNIEEEVIEEEDAVRKIEGEMFQRALVTDFRAATEERTIEFPFASEAPVERWTKAPWTSAG
jgi:NADH dehydrogenase/NADH:ubiquinone oxidoreductase subunit G